jgi:hypothetical protein
MDAFLFWMISNYCNKAWATKTLTTVVLIFKGKTRLNVF